MSTVWITVAGLIVTTAAIKAIGPMLFGGRTLPPLIARVIPGLPPALLAALVVTETLQGGPHRLVIDARSAGLVAAGLALAARMPLIVVVILAAGVTALTRALT